MDGRNGIFTHAFSESSSKTYGKNGLSRRDTVDLLNSILEDGEQGELLITLRQLTKAFGGVQDVAEKANLNPTQLYRTLSDQGNPELRSLSAILKVMGLRLAVERVRAA